MSDYFVHNGIYIHKQIGNYETLFICEASFAIPVGKLVQYITKDNPKGEAYWERTSIQYFLNNYIEDDIRELFVDRNNYEQVGMINNNFKFVGEDRKILIKQR